MRSLFVAGLLFASLQAGYAHHNTGETGQSVAGGAIDVSSVSCHSEETDADASNNFATPDADTSYQLALGCNSQAYGENSLAIGFNALSGEYFSETGTSDNTIAVGADSSSFAENGIALGYQANVGKINGAFQSSSGANGIAIGQNADVRADYGIAIGAGAGEYLNGLVPEYGGGESVSLGRRATGGGFGSLAIGGSSYASGNQGIALGYGARASGLYSAAIGAGATAWLDNQIVFGTGSTIERAPSKYYFPGLLSQGVGYVEGGENYLSVDALGQITLLQAEGGGAGGGTGQIGANDGWSPVIAVENVDDRSVQRIVDWVGGTGVKPTVLGYVGTSGIVNDASLATDISGSQGVQGAAGMAGVDGQDGSNGWSPLLAVETVDGRSVQRIVAWTGGTGTAPTLSGYLGSGEGGGISVVQDPALATDIRGSQGVAGVDGVDGLDGVNGADGADGQNGSNGWSPIIAVENVNGRSVQRVIGWTGGTGDAPTIEGYIGAGENGNPAIVATPELATDIRGAEGAAGGSGMSGQNMPDAPTVMAGVDPSEIARLDQRIDGNRNYAKRGIAIAIAMEKPAVQPGDRGAVTLNIGHYDGANALGWSFSVRSAKDPDVIFNGGMGVSQDHGIKEFGARIGITKGF